MVQGEDGVWEFTTPLPSGTFSYTFLHDCPTANGAGCTRHPDPANPGWSADAAAGTRQTLSQVYVPEHPRYQTYDNDYQAPSAASAAGTLEQRTYVSPTSTNPVGSHTLSVYLPADYDPDRAVPYPTLYLSHGGGGNDTDWTTQGAAHHIVENAIADGDAPSMVIVSTNFNGIPGGNTGYAADVRLNVIPFVEAEYNVSTDPADRAFAGLSLGGSRANTMLYDNTDLFEYFGSWSAAGGPSVPTDAQLARIRGVDGAIHMGTGLQDWLININLSSLARVDALQARGVTVDELERRRHPLLGRLAPAARRVRPRHRLRHDEHHGGRAGPRGSARLSATVDPLSTLPEAPSGTVDFYAGEQLLGSARLGADGVAVLPRAKAADAPAGVVAVYRGDDLYRSSSSATP